MKNETKQLAKIISKTADKYGQSTDRILSDFVEMTYQYAVTGTYSQNYAFMQIEHNKFLTYLMNSMKKRPYFDYFAELMVELNKFDKKKMCQCMTPPEVVSAITLVLNSKSSKQRMGEPTCGTGSFVLELVKNHVELKDPEKSFELIINDLDERLIKIAVIQCLFNLMVNNVDQLPDIQITAYQNDLIKEYKKNGRIVYANDPNRITDPYVMRFLEHKREQEFHRKMLDLLSGSHPHTDEGKEAA
ncbi:DNA methylase adenine-specific domain-containing protein [Vibrio crassostreae]|uniref:N-6 DNA methylase n=1 Tax=Vibrio crassostreae TaxID=246167 RepID=UPI0010521C34|nr:N-6 DNA methylase [Vibrio crassostreae]TCT63768.1 N-6 DNA methylase [Vibrio crassostreae]CAK2017871.1 DNA methylase adenine-specific domain-containing protein [Vibrio crassostreae]CAK2072515.1 DNA methylase adenine-specific domain-containing protein [Vibrio crassostreae]CAK2089122.1 DNA methylase adenine-specific domain-containing protein [Vibrio crassostreae]CAK2147078.1 DNA methylase adenine-specific domain-containing protein [Vibrio crassostreae]